MSKSDGGGNILDPQGLMRAGMIVESDTLNKTRWTDSKCILSLNLKEQLKLQIQNTYTLNWVCSQFLGGMNVIWPDRIVL